MKIKKFLMPLKFEIFLMKNHIFLQLIENNQNKKSFNNLCTFNWQNNTPRIAVQLVDCFVINLTGTYHLHHRKTIVRRTRISKSPKNQISCTFQLKVCPKYSIIMTVLCAGALSNLEIEGMKNFSRIIM